MDHSQIRVIVAEVHPMFRAGLRHTVESNPLYLVVGEAADVGGVLELVRSKAPDILICDIDLDSGNAPRFADSLRDIDPALRIVLLTDHKDEDSLERSLGIDADGYITNQSGASEVLACLDALREGKKFTSAVITTYLFKRESARRAIAAGEVLGLTKSERLVLRMVAEHRTNREIGDALCISHRTVENHRTIICSKLGLRGPHALVKFALTHKKNL